MIGWSAILSNRWVVGFGLGLVALFGALRALGGYRKDIRKAEQGRILVDVARRQGEISNEARNEISRQIKDIKDEPITKAEPVPVVADDSDSLPSSDELLQQDADRYRRLFD